MTSAQYVILEHICPAAGMILSNLMFFASFRDVKKAVKRGSLGHLNPTPWAFMTGNCLGWVTYSFLINNLYIYFANGPGLVLSIWLNLSATKLQYAEFRVHQVRESVVRYLEEGSERRLEVDEPDARSMSQKAIDFGKIVLRVTAQTSKAPAEHELIVLVMVVIWIGLISLVRFADFSLSVQELVVGVAVNVNLLFFYGAPLSTIWTVLKTRNAASIHVCTMCTNTMNGVFWSAYGIAVRDPFVYVPNALGAGLGVVQLLLLLAFPRKLVEDPLDEGRESDVDSLGDIDDVDKRSGGIETVDMEEETL